MKERNPGSAWSCFNGETLAGMQRQGGARGSEKNSRNKTTLCLKAILSGVHPVWQPKLWWITDSKRNPQHCEAVLITEHGCKILIAGIYYINNRTITVWKFAVNKVAVTFLEDAQFISIKNFATMNTANQGIKRFCHSRILLDFCP